MGKYDALLVEEPKRSKYADLLVEPSAPAPVQAPGKSWGEALAENVPFGTTALAVGKGEAPYPASSRGIAQLAGDVGAGAGLGAAGAMGVGLGPIGLGLGAGALAGAGMEKAGISPAMRGMGERIMQADKVAPFVESSNPIMKALQYASAIEGQVPAAVKSASWEVLPGVLSTLAGAAGIGGVKAIAKAPTRAPGGAGLLQEAGVKITPAMEKFAETGKRTGVSGALEQLATSNPLTSGSVENIRNAAANAVKAKVSGIGGAGLSPQASGGLLAKVMETFQARRGGAVGSAKAALRSLDAGDVGKVASNKIIAQLEKGGVPFDEKGFNVEAMKGGSRLDPATAQTLVQVERDMRGFTLEEAINYLEHFDQKMAPALSEKYGTASTNAIKNARNIIKSTIVETAGSIDKNLAKALTDADRQYSISQPTAKPFLKASRGDMPEADLPGKLFGKAGVKGDKSLSRLQKTMTPDEFGVVQDTLAAEVLRASGGAENLSLAKLRTSLKNLGENSKFLKPEAMKALEDAALMLETAGVAEAGMPNPSGSSRGIIYQSTLPAVGAAGMGAAMGNPVPLAGMLGGAAAVKGYMAYPGLRNALLKGAQRVIPSNINMPVGASLATAPAFVQALNR